MRKYRPIITRIVVTIMPFLIGIIGSVKFLDRTNGNPMTVAINPNAQASNGNITNCNFIKHDIGLMIFDESNVIIKNSNFINNERYGLGIITELPYVEISYSNFWGNEEADCMENCPG